MLSVSCQTDMQTNFLPPYPSKTNLGFLNFLTLERLELIPRQSNNTIAPGDTHGEVFHKATCSDIFSHVLL